MALKTVLRKKGLLKNKHFLDLNPQKGYLLSSTSTSITSQAF
jgi:hypothetical protein